MINIENTQVFGWEAAIRGMRNPMNSWEKSDSSWVADDNFNESTKHYSYRYLIGTNDHDLMMRLVMAGDEHAKFMRMIHVQMDILAPLYWWKQADTYKVGFVTNSCSTMHKIQAKEFVWDDFSNEHLDDEYICATDNPMYKIGDFYLPEYTAADIQTLTIEAMNYYRKRYLETKDKKYWWQMIQLLPDSYNQLRTCDTNYATLRKMYHQRKGHKLDEWNSLIEWIETLPYSELITAKE